MEPIIHQVWVGPYLMPERERAFVRKMKEKHTGFEHRLWTDLNSPELEMPAPVRERFLSRMSNKDYAFAADILRVFAVFHFGGVYLDVDTDTRDGLDSWDLRNKDGVFRHHCDGDLSFSNDFLGMSAGHPLGQFLLNQFHAPAYDFGPYWLGKTVKQYVGLPVEASHSEVRERLSEHNMLYVNSDEAYEGLYGRSWTRHFHNAALFSWSEENRKKFEAGDYV